MLRIFNTASSVHSLFKYLSYVQQSPKDFEDITYINRQQRLLAMMDEHKFPSKVESQILNADFGSYYLEGDQLVNYPSSPLGGNAWKTVTSTFYSCFRWLVDQLLAFKPWLLQVFETLTQSPSKKFFIVSGIIVFSAVAGSYHFYYKEQPSINDNNNIVPYDLISCIICNDAPRSHMFVPCGHMVTCAKCTQFFANQERDCPMCRTVITNSVKVHLS